MHRFFITPDQIEAEQVTLTGSQAQQISKVLRLQVGDEIIVLDNSGWEYAVGLTAVAPQIVQGHISHKQICPNEPSVQLTLFISLIKWERFEWALQKATEIGATRLVPTISQRSFLGKLSDISAKRQERWQRIITEAAEQSRRGKLPELGDPCLLGDGLATAVAFDLALIPWEEETRTTIRTALALMNPTTIAAFIGPEGGFAEDEVALARAHRVVPITLGRRILRAETAVAVTTTLILHELDHRL